MIQKIKSKLLAISTMLLFATPMAVPAIATAAVDIQGNACSGAQDLQFGGTVGCDQTVTEAKANTFIEKVINILSVIVGIIAVIMIIFGGFKYVTSGGDSTKVGSAKSTILYALIGLVIVAIAQVIVRFVLGTTTTTVGAP